MARAKYFAGTEAIDPGTVYHVSGHSWDRYGLPGVPFPGRRPWSSILIGKRANGERAIVRYIDYNPHGSRHKCDARCLNAKGHNCECSCGGANHGSAR